ncbi:hypothetical protein TWF481_003897 [Arthrobotrys musiformis]|uniref:PARG catalytic Macro domain-containing protein n=1 Tax=Arthrobotrys musiformis TaxID=47236 RepID=A0AAV9WHW8_9PEZI
MAVVDEASELGSLLLPNHPSFTTDDPLGFSDAEEYPVPVYSILESHLFTRFESVSPAIPPESLTSEFVSVISDLSYTLHNRPDPNLSILKYCMNLKPDPAACTQLIVSSASKLPTLFSDGSLHPLRPGETRVYTGAHLLSILSHQLLLTLPSPKWNDWGGVNLTSWFSDADGNNEPKRTYTNITLDHFLQFTAPPPQPQDFTFHLCHYNQPLTSFTTKTPLIPLTILELPNEEDFPKTTTLPAEDFHTTYIISSHKLIGHGPSATQEERILASIPELIPVSTFTPPLEENTALAVTASAENGFTPTAIFTGHGRTARVDGGYNCRDYEGENVENRIRANTFLFLNATELDTVEIPESEDGARGLPDFLPGVLQKDLLKAYTGFSGVFGSQTGEGGKNQRIIATPWGSGAFGGDVRVKLLILWVAASFAAAKLGEGQNAELVFLVKQFVIDAKEVSWKEILQKVQESGVGADDVWRALMGMGETNVPGINVLEGLVDTLGLKRPLLI